MQEMYYVIFQATPAFNSFIMFEDILRDVMRSDRKKPTRERSILSRFSVYSDCPSITIKKKNSMLNCKSVRHPGKKTTCNADNKREILQSGDRQ